MRTITLFILSVGILAGGGYLFFKLFPDNIKTGQDLVNITSPAAPIIKSISQDEYLRYYNPAQKPKEEPKHEECIKIDNSHLHARCEEAYIITKYPEVTRLDESCLEIVLKNRNKKKLCDDKMQEGWPATRYSFLGYVPDIGYWFRVQFWEGNAELLVNDKTGEGMDIFGKPILSPAGDQFLSVGVDLSEAQYNINGFQVWQKRGDSYILKVKYAEDILDAENIFGIIDPVWVNENSFYFVKRHMDSGFFDPKTNTYVETKGFDEYAEFSF